MTHSSILRVLLGRFSPWCFNVVFSICIISTPERVLQHTNLIVNHEPLEISSMFELKILLFYNISAEMQCCDLIDETRCDYLNTQENDSISLPSSVQKSKNNSRKIRANSPCHSICPPTDTIKRNLRKQIYEFFRTARWYARTAKNIVSH